MKKSNFIFKLVFLTTVLTSCFRKSTLDKDNKIEWLGKPIKIEFYKHIQGQAFKYSSDPEFILTDSIEIKDALTEIKDADNPEPWKGAGWDKVIITYKDTVIKLNTDKKRIGLSASGSFYSLNDNNFMTKQFKDH